MKGTKSPHGASTVPEGLPPAGRHARVGSGPRRAGAAGWEASAPVAKANIESRGWRGQRRLLASPAERTTPGDWTRLVPDYPERAPLALQCGSGASWGSAAGPHRGCHLGREERESGTGDSRGLPLSSPSRRQRLAQGRGGGRAARLHLALLPARQHSLAAANGSGYLYGRVTLSGTWLLV